MNVNLNTHMSFEKFKNFNEMLNKHFNVVTKEESETSIEDYESDLKAGNISNKDINLIIVDPIKTIL